MEKQSRSHQKAKVEREKEQGRGQVWREPVSAMRKIWKWLESFCFEGGSVQAVQELACG